MSNAQFMINDLRVDGLPSGAIFVDSATPTFSWKLYSSNRGFRQRSYRIMAASDVDKLTSPDLWDSGEVINSAQVAVPWNGKKLHSRQLVFWAVEIINEHGESERSNTASFELSLLSNRDWTARWIFFEGINPDAPSACPFYRKEFHLAQPLARARLYATARGVFEASINGKRVGFDRLVPGWTDFRKQTQFMSYDVTSLLNAGENVLGAIVGDGWCRGYFGGRQRNHYSFTMPELLMQLELVFADGSMTKIVTGSGWKCSVGAILSSDIYDGEVYDSRLEFPNWNLPGFDDSTWRRVKTGHVGRSTPRLTPKCCLPVRSIMEKKPIAVFSPRPDTRIWDFGQNLSGVVRARLRGNPGTVYTFKFGEMLNPDGTLYNLNYRSARATDYYTCSETSSIRYVEWEPRFTFHGFRYLQIDGWQFNGVVPEELDPVAVVLHSDLETTGSFHCGHGKLNQLFNNINWGQRGNFLEIPSDCPQRDERLGWLGDAQVFVGTAAYNMNVGSFFRKFLRDMCDAQRVDGAVARIAPDILPPNFGVAAWADAAVICPWIIYRHYGDSRILAENYDMMRRWVEFQRNTSSEFIRPPTSYGDWLALSKIETPSSLIGTAYFAYTSGLLAQCARVLNLELDAKYFSQLSEDIKVAFRKKFLNPQGELSPLTQTGCALALDFELLDEAERNINAELLVRLIGDNGNKLDTGFVGTSCLNRSLSKVGHTSIAYDLLLQEEFPSWLFSVNQGATTVWERWNSYTVSGGFGNVNMNSFNHYAYGAVAEWIYETIAGIQFGSGAPAGAELIYAAEPDRRLGFVDAVVETAYGCAESNWRFAGELWHWHVSAPSNTAMQVVLPIVVPDGILIDNRPLKLHEYTIDAGRIKVLLPCGSYDFTIDCRNVSPPISNVPR